MQRPKKLRLVRDNFNALDLLSMEGFRAPPPAKAGVVPKVKRLRRWRRRRSEAAPKRPFAALLPLIGKKFRNRGRHDGPGRNISVS